MESGKAGSEMDLEHRCGLMVQSMMETGRKERLMAKAPSLMLTETRTRASGLMTKRMVWESISIQMERLMKGTGRTTCRKEKGLRDGLTALCMKACTRKARSTGSGSIDGATGASSTETGLITKSQGLESTNGSMGESTGENGSRTTWRDTAFIRGKTAERSKVNT